MNNFFYPSIDVKESGRRIDQVRKERNFSVKDLQIYFGFSAPQAIYKWLSGQSLPSTDHLLALSFLFQTPMAELLVYNTIELNYNPREESRDFLFLGIILRPLEAPAQ